MPYKPCEICIEEKCNGKYNCNCDSCNVKDKCNKNLNATIRITKKCTQRCNHCCFSCSPSDNTHMSIEMAKKINQFLINNHFFCINIMGGEFFCNPKWKEIIEILIKDITIARLVSNGDWAKNPKEYIEFFKRFNNLYISISKTKFHTNKYVDKAIKLLEENNIMHNSGTIDENGIVPVGRGSFHVGAYSMVSNYCSNPGFKYSLLIDEEGIIYKCVFGIWDYAEVEEYPNDSFRHRFKEFNKIFYKTFIPNCKSCIHAYKKNNLS